MNTLTKLTIFVLGIAILSACASAPKEDQRENRKIYLTEEDYLEELGREAAKERREAPPAPESEYIFNTVPETDKAVYFFDDRQQPKVPGQPSDADYKREKRLWNKPKRYTPEQYYGMQGGTENTASSSSSEMLPFPSFASCALISSASSSSSFSSGRNSSRKPSRISSYSESFFTNSTS